MPGLAANFLIEIPTRNLIAANRQRSEEQSNGTVVRQ